MCSKENVQVSVPQAKRGVLPQTGTGSSSGHNSWHLLIRSTRLRHRQIPRWQDVRRCSRLGDPSHPRQVSHTLDVRFCFLTLSRPPGTPCLTTRLKDPVLSVRTDFPVGAASGHPCPDFPQSQEAHGDPLPNVAQNTPPSLLRLRCPPNTLHPLYCDKGTRILSPKPELSTSFLKVLFTFMP